MTTDLSNFARRVRDFIQHCATGLSAATEPGSRDSEFNDLAVALFRLQFPGNAPYRRWCEAQGVTAEAVTQWRQIPAVPTAAFKEWDLTCLAPAERTRVFHSSGTTTQQPSRHFHHADSLALYEASLWPWLKRHLPLTATKARFLSLTPNTEQAPHSSLVHMFDFARQKMGASVNGFVGQTDADGTWWLDFDRAFALLGGSTTACAVKGNTDSRPWLVLGTAFSFVQLLDELERRDCRLCLPNGSFVLETGGYKGRSRVLPKASLYQLIAERLGVPETNIICEYGMSELSSQAYDLMGRPGAVGASLDARESSRRRVFQFPPWARVRVISPETGREVDEGEIGLLQIFDLANVFSVLAVQPEDLAVRRSSGFELIGRAVAAEPRGCSLMSA